MLSSGVSLLQAELVAKLEAEYANASKTGNVIDDKLQEMTFSYTDKSIISTLDETRRQHLKKKKPDYRLYPIFQHVVNMLNSCKSTLDELFVYGDPDSEQATVLSYTETAKHFSDLSKENASMVTEMYNIHTQVKDRPEEIRKGWIKNRVPQDRFSKKGQEYAIS